MLILIILHFLQKFGMVKSFGMISYPKASFFLMIIKISTNTENVFHLEFGGIPGIQLKSQRNHSLLQKIIAAEATSKNFFGKKGTRRQQNILFQYFHCYAFSYTLCGWNWVTLDAGFMDVLSLWKFVKLTNDMVITLQVNYIQVKF